MGPSGKAGYFIENHAAYSWQEALTPMVKGEAAMYVMGNFAVAPLREAGLTDDQLGFFQFLRSHLPQWLKKHQQHSAYSVKGKEQD